MEISGTTRIVGFLANPAKHSISPAMHNAAFAACGVDARYFAFELERDDLINGIQSIKTLNMLGANVSMPFKTAALPLMDELSAAAQLIGAINTVKNVGGKLIGDNTDGKGFMASLQELKVETFGQTVTILGGGGAAIAIIAQAALDGVQKINVAVRNPAAKIPLQEKLAEIATKTACQIDLLDLHAPNKIQTAINESCLLVNATSVGMGAGSTASPLPAEIILPEKLFVYDIIYNPRVTPLLKSAQAAGLQTSNGLPMLLHQGAVAFKLWTGRDFPMALIRPLVEKS